MSVTGGWVLWLFVDAMPPFVGTWGLMVVEGGILLGFSRNSLLTVAENIEWGERMENFSSSTGNVV